jgi:hypothetical protein
MAQPGEPVCSFVAQRIVAACGGRIRLSDGNVTISGSDLNALVLSLGDCIDVAPFRKRRAALLRCQRVQKHSLGDAYRINVIEDLLTVLDVFLVPLEWASVIRQAEALLPAVAVPPTVAVVAVAEVSVPPSQLVVHQHAAPSVLAVAESLVRCVPERQSD